LGLVCFGFLPGTRAQLPSPTPDGGYPNNNTAEGTNALFSLTTGTDNTAVGFNALFSDATFAGGQTGDKNTAVGSQALFSNDAGSENTAVGYKALHDMIFTFVPLPPPHLPTFQFLVFSTQPLGLQHSPVWVLVTETLPSVLTLLPIVATINSLLTRL